MRILVFGKTGQVASELQKIAAGHAAEFIFAGRERADLAETGVCARLISQVSPDAVINAAAYTAVDKAETDEDLAQKINGQAPGEMARACAALNIPIVHISTDYVFDGAGSRPFDPSDPLDPLGAYGRGKALGERSVQTAGAVFGILRTSWVFSAHGTNFVKTMRRLGVARDSLTIVADQVGGPTSAASIARACVRMVAVLRTNPEACGIYHFSGAPDVSWADFAREIFVQAGLNCDVTDIPTSAYPTPARRPQNSRMNCATTQNVFGLERPDWRTDLQKVISDLGTIASS